MESSKYSDAAISPPPIINEGTTNKIVSNVLSTIILKNRMWLIFISILEDELTSDISSSHSDELEVSKRRTEARRAPFNGSHNK